MYNTGRMGFIEDERRKQEARLEDYRRNQTTLEEKRSQKKISEETEKVAQAARTKEAERQFEQSGLNEMIRELGKLGSHEKVQSWRTHDDYRNHIILSEGDKKNKEVWIKVVSDGTITIQGGIFGSTILPKDEWQGKAGRETLEKALGKAYKHPKLRPGTYIDRSTPTESYPGN